MTHFTENKPAKGDPYYSCIHESGVLVGVIEKYRGIYYFYPHASKSECGWDGPTVLAIAQKIISLNTKVAKDE